jgi:hypothetical protein
MQETGKQQSLIKKAYEIAYALFRIGGNTPNKAFAESIERQALTLLDASAMGDYISAGNAANAVEYTIRLGGDIGIVHQANVQTLIMELGNLNAAIAGLDKPAKNNAAEIYFHDIFAGQEKLFSVNNATPLSKEARESRSEDSPESGNSKMRQTTILERIRQSGNCRLKDLQEILPGSSERTLRYDLQSLIEQNLIERVGNGGPSVSYKMR